MPAYSLGSIRQGFSNIYTIVRFLYGTSNGSISATTGPYSWKFHSHDNHYLYFNADVSIDIADVDFRFRSEAPERKGDG